MTRGSGAALPVVLAPLLACGGGDLSPGDPFGPEPPGPDLALFADRTATHLPTGLAGLSMDAAVADMDGDGDLDVIVAQEFARNVLLLNDGSGRFRMAADRLPESTHDSEDIAIADFDLDGDPDVVIVSEDDQVNELYENDGLGFFSDRGSRIPVGRITNAVVSADLTGDGAPDLILGNAGQNVFLENDGSGAFEDHTASRMPSVADVTQDLELGDVDGDGDLDLIVGNEGANRLLINDGRGVFSDDTAARLPGPTGLEETREADFGDVDGDGDLDVLFANVRSSIQEADPANRLLINDGAGFFTSGGDRLPRDQDRSFDGDLVDVDGDGDLDVVTSNLNAVPGVAVPVTWRVYLNDGTGRFREATTEVLPAGTVGFGFDVEMADFDADGRSDLYLASRGSADRLLFGIR